MQIDNSAHRRRLADVQRGFHAKTAGRAGVTLKMLLRGIAAQSADPYERGLAEQALKAQAVADKINEAAAEHDKLSRVPPDVRRPAEPDYQRNRLARMKELEEQAAEDRERLDTIRSGSWTDHTGAVRSLDGAREEALAGYAAEESKSDKLGKAKALAAEKAEAMASDHVVDMLAVTVNARRHGRDPWLAGGSA